jgi:hypothetical protein
LNFFFCILGTSCQPCHDKPTDVLKRFVLIALRQSAVLVGTSLLVTKTKRRESVGDFETFKPSHKMSKGGFDLMLMQGLGSLKFLCKQIRRPNFSDARESKQDPDLWICSQEL